MKQIRFCIFETNSSSTHNMTIISDEDLQKLKSGPDLYFADNKVLTKAEAIAAVNAQRAEWGGDPIDGEDEDVLNEDLSYYDIQSYEEVIGSNDYECDHNEYTTASGEKIHIICKYGYDR